MSRIPDRQRESTMPPSWSRSARLPTGAPPVARGRRRADYEFLSVTIPPGSSLGQVRQSLQDEAEYGRWELARTQLFLGGGKRVILRRRIIRAVPASDAPRI